LPPLSRIFLREALKEIFRESERSCSLRLYMNRFERVRGSEEFMIWVNRIKGVYEVRLLRDYFPPDGSNEPLVNSFFKRLFQLLLKNLFCRGLCNHPDLSHPCSQAKVL
jgi:hypothetical protein